MKKRNSFIICTGVVLVTNLYMAIFLNNGEVPLSNVLTIMIVLFMLPSFLRAVEYQLTSLVRLESAGLLILTSLSVMRLINRIDTLSPLINSVIILVSVGAGTLLLVASAIRIRKSK